MKIDEILLQIARDALYCRRMRRVGTVAFNAACEELAEYGHVALDAVEYVIRIDVKEDGIHEVDSLCAKYEGLPSLFVRYMRMTCFNEKGVKRGCSFVLSLSSLLQDQALRAIWVIWLLNDEFSPIPQELLRTIETIAQSENLASSRAKDLLDRYRKRCEGKPCEVQDM